MNKVRHAFRQDCNVLIENFIKYESTNFTNFCNEWKKMNFYHIYSPLCTDVEIAQLTTELFLIAKKIVISDRPPLERICGLYILYGFYFIQPIEKKVKIKVTCDDWKGIKRLLNWIDEQSDAVQAKTIFWKLYKDHAFRYVFLEQDYGFESFYQRNDNSENLEEFLSVEDMFQDDINEIQHKSMGLLSAFEDLEEGYNEMKELMNEQSDSNQRFLSTHFFKDLESNFKKIEQTLTKEKDPEESTSKSESAASSIRGRRCRLRNKAFSKEPKYTSEKDGFEISLQGDFIQITRKNDVTNSTNSTKGVDILTENLANESLFELGAVDCTNNDANKKN